MINTEIYHRISEELASKKVTLVAVSKTKPVEDIQALYDLGQRDFGENYVQELVDKQSQMPADIRWHFIGHLQSNKVKYIAPFVHLIHSIDNLKLLHEINKQATKCDRIIDCLAQIHIATEETKFGMNEEELEILMNRANNGEVITNHVCMKGLMGMASNTHDENAIKIEYQHLKSLYEKHKTLSTLSMGMSGDYKIAIEEGSNMVRIGSLLFEAR